MQVKGKPFHALGQQFQKMLAVMVVAKDALMRSLAGVKPQSS
jgi:hypothetical protein